METAGRYKKKKKVDTKNCMYMQKGEGGGGVNEEMIGCVCHWVTFD